MSDSFAAMLATCQHDPDPTNRVTLAAVAEQAGVSLSTISKVLNGRTDVAATTRSKVEGLLQHHGYTRRGGPAAAKTDLIELVFHELDSIWAMELIAGVESVAKVNGLSVVLTESGDQHSPAGRSGSKGCFADGRSEWCWCSPIWRPSTVNGSGHGRSRSSSSTRQVTRRRRFRRWGRPTGPAG